MNFLFRYWRPLVFILLVAVVLGYAYMVGRKHERQVWRDKMEAARVAAAEETQRLVEKNYQISIAVTKILERERVVTRTLLEQVYVQVPADACPVHPSFRVLHDAAARGEDSTPAAGTDAPPVPVKDAAATVVANYGSCREDQARLTKLQDWVSQFAGREVVCPIQ